MQPGKFLKIISYLILIINLCNAKGFRRGGGGGGAKGGGAKTSKTSSTSNIGRRQITSYIKQIFVYLSMFNFVCQSHINFVKKKKKIVMGGLSL